MISSFGLWERGIRYMHDTGRYMVDNFSILDGYQHGKPIVQSTGGKFRLEVQLPPPTTSNTIQTTSFFTYNALSL